MSNCFMPEIAILHRETVVRDSGLWPKLSLHPDGSIFVSFYNQPSHGRLPGDVECWVRRPNQSGWFFCGRVTAHRPNTAHLNHAMGIDAMGNLLVVAGGWSYRRAGEEWVKHRLLRPCTWISSDGGVSWDRLGSLPVGEGADEYVPFGKIETGPDGMLNHASYIYRVSGDHSRRDTAVLMRSRNAGATWKVHGVIHAEEANETDVLHLGEGVWMAAARNVEASDGRKTHSVDLHQSTNDGADWRPVKRLTGPDCHPGHLLRLGDGRMLLTCGDRRDSRNSGILCRLTDDQGVWQPEKLLVTGIPTRDSGYPATVQLTDGSLVTAYYAAAGPKDPGYRLEVVDWELRGR